MKIFTGGLFTETNTFAPFPTGMATFKEFLFLRRNEGIDPPLENDWCRTFIERAQNEGWDVVAGLRSFALPAGRVPQACYEELRKEFLDDLQSALPVDAVLLSLHGAMVIEGEHDGEGDMLRAVREIVGADVPIGVHLDPHCHLTSKMIENADVIKIWKEYPHTDSAERASEVFDLIQARLSGAPRAIPVVHDCRMTQMFHTTREPMRSFVDKIIELEGKDGIQTISIVHSFPWGDSPDMGTKVLVYADDSSSLPQAKILAAQLGQEIWDMREAVGIPFVGLEESLDLAYAAPDGPVVISDGPDNPGGGAPCDATWFLTCLLERDESDWALGYLFDPQAVRIAIEAGEGATLSLRVGGKTCELSGNPVDIKCRVSGIVRDATQWLGEQQVFPAGDAVALDLAGNRHIVLVTLRNQTLDRDLFGQLGVDLSLKQAVIVKSSQHFHASFSKIATEILYAAPPGVVTPDFKSLPYEFADTTIWPLANYQEHSA